MSNYKQYRRSQIAEMADWTPEFDMAGVSISDTDREAGSPKVGDKIARNPKNHADRWLVAATYAADNFEPIAPATDPNPIGIPSAAVRQAAIERLNAENLRTFGYWYTLDGQYRGDNVTRDAHALAQIARLASASA